MKLYLAGCPRRQQEIKGYAASLLAAGHEVTSSWIDADFSAGLGKTTDATRRDIALACIAEIDRSEAVVLFTSDRGSPQIGGGRHFEAGYALGSGRKVFAVGPTEHVFCVLPHVGWFPDFDIFLAGLIGRARP